MMIPDEVLLSLGRLTVNAASLDWYRATTHYLLDPDPARSVDYRLGLSRGRMTRELEQMADRLPESHRVALRQAARESDDGLKLRDERVHALWETDWDSPTLELRWRHKDGASGPADAEDFKQLANDLGRLCMVVGAVRQQVADYLRTQETP